MKFVESTFTNVVEAIKSQAEITRSLAHNMELQMRKQSSICGGIPILCLLDKI